MNPGDTGILTAAAMKILAKLQSLDGQADLEYGLLKEVSAFVESLDKRSVEDNRGPLTQIRALLASEVAEVEDATAHESLSGLDARSDQEMFVQEARATIGLLDRLLA